MKTLRPAQATLVNDTIRQVHKDKHIICQAATGFGKSFMMWSIIQRGLQRGKTFLVLSESIKIFIQLCNEFGAIRIDSGTGILAVRTGNVYVAMSQSLANRKRIIEQFQAITDLYLFIDEAHVGTSRKVIEQFPGYRVGFTATPVWKIAKWLPDLYTSIVIGPQIFDVQQDGHLCTYRHIGRSKIQEGDLVVKGGEYTEKSQEYAFSKIEVYDGIYADLKTVPYRKCVVYCASIHQCEEVTANLRSHGYIATVYHSQDAESAANLAMFTDMDSGVNICVSVAALTKGWDFPAIDLVVLFRATKSLALYLQMCGRGGRPIPGQKTHFQVLDYGLNFQRFGAWDADRDWLTLWQPPKNARKKELPAPVKQCPQCESFVHPTATVCKWCDYIFPVMERVLAQGDLADFTAAYAALLGRKLSELDPWQLATFARTKNKTSHAIRVAKAREYEQEGFLKNFGEAMGYKRMWAYIQRDSLPADRIEYTDIILK